MVIIDIITCIICRKKNAQLFDHTTVVGRTETVEHVAVVEIIMRNRNVTLKTQNRR